MVCPGTEHSELQTIPIHMVHAFVLHQSVHTPSLADPVFSWKSFGSGFIWFRIQHFRLNTNPDPGIYDQKFKKVYSWKKCCYFFIKICNLLLYKGRPSYFFYFLGSFSPSWIRIHWPDPKYCREISNTVRYCTVFLKFARKRCRYAQDIKSYVHIFDCLCLVLVPGWIEIVIPGSGYASAPL
jgi:hypothetical protein